MSGQSCNAAMANPQSRTEDGQKISFIQRLSQVFLNTGVNLQFRYKQFGQGGDGSNRLVLLCLGLLNITLLIAAVVIGINCAKVKEGSLRVSHSAATQLIDELNYLHGNYSDVIKAEEEAKNALESVLKNHTRMKEKIEQQKTINDNYQKQMEALQEESKILLSNVSALEEHCSGCPSGWIPLNSSCYFFSYTESPNVEKNWEKSREDCKSRGADLVVIDYPEEQNFVSHTIDHMMAGGFWVGLTDMNTEGKWVWINNVTEVENRYWMDGEPNDVGYHGEDCAMVIASRMTPWKTRNDANCRHSMKWICEMTSR
ncbi:CD209 antigen-like protein 2 [Epinephelus moara]|uniref:CD209 antigen-like protein 2 n=1 Tax=Epinephelus moara TaxID=300413 RepID=UPI00214E4FA3|nr:CD209 antigen-like protein 2 [Epinephelus moara]